MILVNIEKPVGRVIIWNGGVFRIPHKLIFTSKDEFERFKLMAENFGYEYTILKGQHLIQDKEIEDVQNEVQVEDEVNEVQNEETNETTNINVDIENLEKLKKSELIEIAKDLGIENYDKLSKAKLIAAIKEVLT